MNTETVIARKVIKDQMISNKLDVATNEVNKSVLKAAGSASRKWRQAHAGKQSEKKMKMKLKKRLFLLYGEI